MKMKIWGSRGSIVAPGIKTQYYGGNTSCIELTSASGTQLIIDAGTGIIPLGKQLVKYSARSTVYNYTILLSHTHIDHIQGFIFFEPIFYENSYISIFCPKGTQKSLSKVIGDLFQAQYSPLKSIYNLPCTMDFMELSLKSFYIGSFNITPIPIKHPVPTYAYRIIDGDIDITYATDHEAFENDETNEQFIRAAYGTQVLIHDTQFLDDEYAPKKGWGHSALSMVIKNAEKIKPQMLVLFHHAPEQSDARIDEKIQLAQKMANGNFQVTAAREQVTFNLINRQ